MVVGGGRSGCLAFMKEKSFVVSGDSKDRGIGNMNMWVPQGLQLSPVVFLVWIVPILEEME